MKWLSVLLIVGLAAAGCHSEEPPTEPRAIDSAPIEEDWSTTEISAEAPKHVTDVGAEYAYHQMTVTTGMIRMTSESVPLDPSAATACMLQPPTTHRSPEFLGSSIDDSPFSNIHIYMNESARDAFLSRKPYPVGSRVLKVKRLWDEEFAGVGGMIKREIGYDPAGGDWEYLYQDTESRLSHGKIARCSQCHAARVETGGIFGSWATREPAK